MTKSEKDREKFLSFLRNGAIFVENLYIKNKHFFTSRKNMLKYKRTFLGGGK